MDMELSVLNLVYTEEEIKERLASGGVHFTYRKKDGTEREAYGTRNIDIIAGNDATPSGFGANNRGVITYYDINSGGWRSFRIENFIEFKTGCTV